MHLSAIRNLRARWRDERGFTMLIALMTMTIATLLLGATFVALTNDTTLTRNDLDQQRAYAAAQAGLAAYTYQLNENPNYWELCLSSGGGSSPSPVAVPSSTDSGSTEYYTYQPIIASTAPNGTTSCSTSNPTGTMIEGSTSAAAGSFRIEATGFSGPTGTTLANCTPSNLCVKRTLVAQYKRTSFLNFVYYTDYETLDPAVLYDPNHTPTEPTDCEVHYPNRGSDCGNAISFIPGDVISGPLHSEDTLAICGSNGQGPVFGRSSNDTIQAAGLSTEGQSGCDDTYTMTGTFSSTAPSLTPPPTNSQLLQVASQGGYVYTGKTTIVLNGSTMSVTNSDSQNTGPTGSTVALPGNGVIYDSTDSSGCSVIYTPFTVSYTTDGACGNVYVSGTYSSSLTIASDNDIIIDGNLSPTGVSLSGNPTTPPTPSGNTLLGLIANDFVRVYHSVNNRTGTTGGNCGNNVSNNVDYDPLYIYAAILAVAHSFIVDNYDCGSPLGTLYVYGTIGQLFRGTVGTHNGGTITSGYTKDYVYDDRLASLEPPYFLNPVSAAWYIQRETECDNSC
jgi:Tfp pilus assembly protein PilX